MIIRVYAIEDLKSMNCRYLVESPRTEKWIIVRSFRDYKYRVLSTKRIYTLTSYNIYEQEIDLDLEELKIMYKYRTGFFSNIYNKEDLPEIVERYRQEIWM